MKPQLAEDCKGNLPLTPSLLVEPKWDGIRLLAHRAEDGIYLYTRNGNRKRLRTIEAELEQLPVGTWLDGEAVGLESHNGQVRCSWSLAQSGVQRGDDEKLSYVVFDLLMLNNINACSLPLRGRRDLLVQAFDTYKFVKVSLTPQYQGDVAKWHEEFISQGFEGSIVKQPESRYACGQRGRGWYKLKAEWDIDAVIMGYEAGKGSRTGMIGSIIFGQFRDGELVRRGTCSGMNDALLKEMSDNRDEYLGRVIVVKHNGVMQTGSLRHPQFIRFRDDKPPTECVYDHGE